MSSRTFNTPIREPWNPCIHQLLRAIDNHNAAFFVDRDPWHHEKAAMLRTYLHELKTWIHVEEAAFKTETGELLEHSTDS